MSDKQKALRIAGDLKSRMRLYGHSELDSGAAAELRRLTADCERLAVEVGYQRGMFNQSEAECERLHADCERLRADAQAKQAQIDRLMMEFCPQEMTPEQVKTWGEHQRAAWETHFGTARKDQA